MAKILIGDHFVHPNDIESISDRDVTLTVKKSVPNPKPKPKGLLGKALYSSTVTVEEKHKYHVLVLKVKAGTQTVRPSHDDDSDFSIGTTSYGTHQLYNFYTICDDEKLIEDAKALKKELDNMPTPTLSSPLSTSQQQRQSDIIGPLQQLGMERTLGGWFNPDYLDSSIMIDKSVKTKQDFIDKYM